MTTGPTFTIDGTDCPAVWMSDFRFQDWALVRELTGLDKEQFILAHNDDKESSPDPLVLYGYAAVSWWRAHPLLDRSRMVVEASDWAESQIVLALPAEADAGPPASAEDESDSSSSSDSSSTSNASSKSQDDESDGTNPTDSGQHGSVIGSPESLQVA